MTRIVFEEKYDFKDVLIVPKRSNLASRSEVSLIKNYSFKHSTYKYSGVPIMAANMDGVGTFTMADTLSANGLFTCIIKHYSQEELLEFFNSNKDKELLERRLNNTAYSLGATQSDFDNFSDFWEKSQYKPRYVCIDVANGYTQMFVDRVKAFRDKYKDPVVIAGNVVTPEITEALLFAGADIIKVGIGPGSACSTRIKTGVGYPQLSAVLECADAAHGLGGHIISDGGCTCPGDIAKAFAAGSDFVMLGGMLAGHDEGGLENKVVINGKEFLEFYGMSSQKAQQAHGSSLKEYRASEGRVLTIPYRGPVKDTVQDILGGIRSTCTYTGSHCLKELPKRATFIKANQQFNATYGVGNLNG